ncbi:guanylate kinase [Streptomyces sp. NPDC088387]|uniref:guanylate kinase n=1 Tax=Streptomyces sp. NPDC088387 TaxID=3365859 RepID=UPI00380CD62F
MKRGILLYGPPAVGKDTITAALNELDSRYVQFARMKIGNGKTQGYRMRTPEQLALLEARGDVVYRNGRYGNTYVVDRAGLDRAMEGGRILVVHLGQVDGVRQVAGLCRARWVRVLLWCSKETTARRSRQRGDVDTVARLRAWDDVRADLAGHPRAQWELRLDTDVMAPREVAEVIDRVVRGVQPSA